MLMCILYCILYIRMHLCCAAPRAFLGYGGVVSVWQLEALAQLGLETFMYHERFVPELS